MFVSSNSTLIIHLEIKFIPGVEAAIRLILNVKSKAEVYS
jgi:hypothetical protein